MQIIAGIKDSFNSILLPFVLLLSQKLALSFIKATEVAVLIILLLVKNVFYCLFYCNIFLLIYFLLNHDCLLSVLKLDLLLIAFSVRQTSPSFYHTSAILPFEKVSLFNN